MNTDAPLIILKDLIGNEPTQLYPLQEMLVPHLHTLITGWFSIWCMTALILLVQLAREYIEHRGQTDS